MVGESVDKRTIGRNPVRFVFRIWLIATSPETFVVLSLLWCVDLAAGSIYAYHLDPEFWVKMDSVPFNIWLKKVAPNVFPQSLWVYALVILTYLVVVSLILCTVKWLIRKRKKIHGMGEFFVHLGFLLVFAGFVFGSGFGARVQGVSVPVGGSAMLKNMGFELAVDSIEPVVSPDGRLLDTVSKVRMVRDGVMSSSGVIRTNHPLIEGSIVVYPRTADLWISGGMIAADGMNAVALSGANPYVLPDGRSLHLGGVLQRGQKMGPYMGPGILVVLNENNGSRAGMGLLSFSPDAGRSLKMGGIRVSLVEFIETVYGTYDIHRDPGIRLVIIGAFILAVGSIWALAGYLASRRLKVPSTE